MRLIVNGTELEVEQVGGQRSLRYRAVSAHHDFTLPATRVTVQVPGTDFDYKGWANIDAKGELFILLD